MADNDFRRLARARRDQARGTTPDDRKKAGARADEASDRIGKHLERNRDQ